MQTSDSVSDETSQNLMINENFNKILVDKSTKLKYANKKKNMSNENFLFFFKS